MENLMLQLNIPVPPAPLLEQAMGYQNYRNAHFLALWWEPCGDEVMVSDGLVTLRVSGRDTWPTCNTVSYIPIWLPTIWAQAIVRLIITWSSI